MLAIGLPSGRFAHEPSEQDDEDSLDREAPNDDRPEDTLTEIYKGLRAHRPEAADRAMAVAKCLERMVHAASRSDDKALQHWFETCCGVVDGEDNGGRDGE
jgi:hypothetical protein